MTLMKKTLTAALAGGIALSSLALTAHAQDQNPAVGARQGHMQIMSLNIGVLSQMARQNVDYDADTAQVAADNLLALTQINQQFYWPQGTDSDSIEGTRALPAIWSDFPGVMAAGTQFSTAAEGLVAVAGDGLVSMRTALGPVGTACGACHDDYRQPR